MPEFYDTETENPFDANYNFSFLDAYIANVGRKAASPNNQSLEDENSEFYDLDESVDEVETQEETEAVQTEPDQTVFFEDDLFAEDENTYVNEYLHSTYNPSAQAQLENTKSIPNTDNTKNTYTPTSGAVTYKPGVSGQGLKSTTSQLIDGLSEMVGNVTVTSTVRSKAQNNAVGGAKNSYHLTGDAVDLRPGKNIDAFLSSAKGRAYMSQQGYQVIDERGKKGSAHWHLEPAKRKRAGGVATTKRQQYIGLNDESLDELMLPLTGQNTIRGLDNGQPVQVTDENGFETVLYGPEDQVMMQGVVQEKRLKI